MTIQSLDDLEKELESNESVPNNLNEQKEVTNEQVEPTKEIKQETIKPSTTLKFDLSTIKIRRSENPLDTFENIKELTLRPTFDVIALQSAYRLSFKSLNNDDILKIRKVSGTAYETNRKMLLHIFNHIENFSVGKIDFDTWLKITSEKDFDTLVYGLYCATYPKESDYVIACPHCNSKNTLKMSKESLIEVKDNKVFDVVKSIVDRKLSPRELIKESSLNYANRIALPESNIIIDLINPSLFDMLQAYNKIVEYKNVEPEIFGYLKHISNILIPDMKTYNRTGDLSFIQLESIEDKLAIIKELNADDSKYLIKAITDKLEEYRVEYKLPNIKCNKCTNEITNINVDMTEVLFRKLAEG